MSLGGPQSRRSEARRVARARGNRKALLDAGRGRGSQRQAGREVRVLKSSRGARITGRAIEQAALPMPRHHLAYLEVRY
jgi:hypothetical protein